MTFADLSVNNGNTYTLTADCGSPYDQIESSEFEVSDLEIRFSIEPPVATKKEGTFSVALTFWDPVTNAVAVAPLPSGITCDLKLSDGSTESTLESGTLSDSSKFLAKILLDHKSIACGP